MNSEINTVKEDDVIIIRNMKETGFIVSFCETFKSCLKGIDFWPEELERAIADSAENDLIEQIHCVFLSNCLNRFKQVTRQSWKKLLSDTIDQKLKKSYQFYKDYNPLRRAKSYYELDVKDKVLILNNLVNWQLQECKQIRKIIEEEYRKSKKNKDNSLIVEPYGDDRKGRKYFYFGKGARLYRETILPGKGKNPDRYKFETITTTIEDLENYVNDPKEIKASARKDKALYNNLVKELIPAVKESIDAKERKESRKLRQEKLAQKVALMHANSEVVASRTRSGTRKALGLEPYPIRQASSITAESSNSSSRNEDEYTGPHMTRSRSNRNYVKRKYLESSTDDEKDANAQNSTRPVRASKRLRAESSGSSPHTNGVGVTTRSRALSEANSDEASEVGEQNEINEIYEVNEINEAHEANGNGVVFPEATPLVQGGDSETPIFKEVFGSDSENLSEPSSSSIEGGSVSDYKPEDGEVSDDE